MHNFVSLCRAHFFWNKIRGAYVLALGGADMKKFLVMICMVMAVSGCSSKVEEEVPQTYDLIPQVMVDDEIYIDTGRESEITGRCGVMDGEITSEVPGSEQPTENNQSNFGTGYGYQRVGEDVIELLIDNKWIVFEKENKEEELWGITLEAKDVTPSGMTLLCRQSGGNLTGDLETGEDYSLYVMEDGEWEEVEPIIDEYGWNSVAWLIEEGGTREFEINWEWLYGELPEGTYRLDKTFMDFRGTADFDEKIYSVQFNICP